MNYQETITYLYNQLPAYQRIGKAAYKADLTTTMELDKYFGHPHQHYRTIHVAGTNGKGSTSHMIASVLQSAGYKVGLYTSPHLFDFRERIKINGAMISEQAVVDFVAAHRAIMAELKPSFFEMTAAMAFDYFAREQVDVAVIETGMGGRLDSTNIISPLLSIITNIGLDHVEFLGDSIAKIAVEKAGIIKPDVPVVVGEWDNESAPVFIQKAEACGASITFADKALEINGAVQKGDKQYFSISAIDTDLFFYVTIDVAVDLLGIYQKKNILTVLTAIEILRRTTDLEITAPALFNGLAVAAAQTGLKGRWQVLQQTPLVVCDTGHNAHGLTYVIEQLKALSYEHLYFIFGVVNDKDVDHILPLLPRDAYYFFTQADLPRAMDAKLLAEKCKNAGLQGEVVLGVANALKQAKAKAVPNDVIFVGGSTFVVAEVV